MLAIVHKILRFFFPPFCCACKKILKQRDALCAACMATIKPLASKTLHVSAKYSMPVHCVGAYDEPLKQFVLAKAYSDKLACYYMAQLIYQLSLFKSLEIDYIVPVPLHWRRYAKRGYNQSAEIAHCLSQRSGIPVMHALKRAKATEYQSRCDKNKRFENVKNVFVLALDATQIKILNGKRLLLVDDVMTTGATLAEAAKVLNSIKPVQITACVLART